METIVKKVFIENAEDFENCYIFSPSIGKKKNIDGKTYHVKRYFNGDRDFETSMKKFATNNYYKKGEKQNETEKIYSRTLFQIVPRR